MIKLIISYCKFALLILLSVLTPIFVFTSCMGNLPKLMISEKHRNLDNIIYIDPIDNIRDLYYLGDKKSVDSLANLAHKAMYYAIHENQALLYLEDELEIKSKKSYSYIRNDIIKIIRKINDNKNNYKLIKVPKDIKDLVKSNKYALITYQQNLIKLNKLIYINDLINGVTAALYHCKPEVLEKNNFKLIVIIFDLKNDCLAFYGEIDNPEINPFDKIAVSEQYSIILNKYRNKIIRGK